MKSAASMTSTFCEPGGPPRESEVTGKLTRIGEASRMTHVMKYSILVICLVVAPLAGCSDTVNNTDLCRRIYGQLCQRANECEAVESLDACVVFYREDCRNRRLPPNVREPLETEIQDCLTAVSTMSCSNLDPKTLDECSFLVDSGEDAGVEEDADTGDAGDAGADAD